MTFPTTKIHKERSKSFVFRKKLVKMREALNLLEASLFISHIGSIHLNGSTPRKVAREISPKGRDILRDSALETAQEGKAEKQELPSLKSHACIHIPFLLCTQRSGDKLLA
jgi:hypothetical protein